jgi:uncharacterized protein (DUF58 family)
MRSFVEPQVIARLQGLALNARGPMIGSVSGRHRSPTRGSSLEFSEYRKYVPGDDTRRLDWRAWGRSDRYYIKEFEADTNLRLCLVVDVSGSMNFGPEGLRDPGTTRLDYARRLAGTLAYLASGQGDAVGLYSSGPSGLREIRPRRSASHLKFVLDELAGMKAGGESELATALHQAAERIAQRALVIVISDLIMDPEPLRSAFQHLRFRRHDVAVFHLLDRNEVEFQFDRPIRFLDLEGGGSLLADPVTIAAQYREAVQQWLEQLHGMFRETGVDYHRVDMAQHYAEALARFLIARKS